MTAGQALVLATRRLTAAGIEGAATDARRLLAHVLGLAPERLLLAMQDEISPDQQAAFEAATDARTARRPVSQITGLRRFWGLDFRVTRDTLDPRPETEILVEAALEEPFATVLDLGTGTGCILVSLLHDRSDARGTGVDLSEAALTVARDNAVRLGVAERARFLRSDWFSAVTGTFDLIVSNPPYIAAEEMPALSPEVRDWEPHLALTPGGDGLAPYRVIAREAAARLASGGRLLLEIGPTQAGAVCDLLRGGGFERIEVRRDLDGRDRTILARKPAVPAPHPGN
ncbi:peptide chain release factor N(5)-glutamine methyltransferase [Paenirhodobacter populi]|uniref:peptide chain release factor N(5)-glutamine methyltransferase n=1 Tax=Paenirhodobacter populi TaxID=2306993 RepID=UPI000FE43BE5|nr:peptide chain release factor N(5)-glutamine methyltransferase [Sinirhodobacter populi]RWR09361.1 peptide chain release factor N(5)-glutamine methyltransferase [Sinirhodobacter populi]